MSSRFRSIVIVACAVAWICLIDYGVCGGHSGTIWLLSSNPCCYRFVSFSSRGFGEWGWGDQVDRRLPSTNDRPQNVKPIPHFSSFCSQSCLNPKVLPTYTGLWWRQGSLTHLTAEGRRHKTVGCIRPFLKSVYISLGVTRLRLVTP